MHLVGGNFGTLCLAVTTASVSNRHTVSCESQNLRATRILSDCKTGSGHVALRLVEWSTSVLLFAQPALSPWTEAPAGGLASIHRPPEQLRLSLAVKSGIRRHYARATLQIPRRPGRRPKTSHERTIAFQHDLDCSPHAGRQASKPCAAQDGCRPNHAKSCLRSATVPGDPRPPHCSLQAKRRRTGPGYRANGIPVRFRPVFLADAQRRAPRVPDRPRSTRTLMVRGWSIRHRFPNFATH